MRVLTVRQPFASAIVEGFKPVENRTVEWSYRGPLVIHAAAAHHRDVRPVELEAMPAEWLMVGALPTSAVVGMVQMVGAHRGDDDCCPGNVWARRDPGTVHLVFSRPVRFLSPILGVRGGLSLWVPDPLLGVRIRRQVELARAAAAVDNVRELTRDRV